MDDLRQAALDYHKYPRPGKLEVIPTKPMANQRDLALAYSPGVAAASEAIVADPAQAAELTNRSNLVAVISNGTAVLGLGDIGPLAAKPVMEGKAALFKKFAGIDVFDLEIAEKDPKKVIDIVASLEPSFGGINLEDIKAPECFAIEQQLKERMNIPVFHDDQHGTAIIVAAALINGLEIVGKKISEVKIAVSGAGAAALACLDLLVELGLNPQHVWVSDIKGVVYEGRTEEMDERKARYAQDTKARKLEEILEGADIFLGLSAPRVLKAEWLPKMAPKPLIFALANPTPEIMPDEIKAVRPDAIIATGRSDYPNQVNNVLCFPFIFRGALDAGATTINEAMKRACVYALANLAKQSSSDVVQAAYHSEVLTFGPNYLIPKPFDPRLLVELAPAVARAAMESGVATRPITDFTAYRQKLEDFVFRSGLVMKPIFSAAKHHPMRVVFAEGEEERVLQAVQVLVDENIAKPILVGRPFVIESRLQRLGLRIQPGRDFELVNVLSDPRYNEYWTLYHSIMERSGVSPDLARTTVRNNTTVIAALMVKRGEADAMICGTIGRYNDHLHHTLNIIGLKAGVATSFAVNLLILQKGFFFLCDTYVNPNPSSRQVAEMTLMAADIVRDFGLSPKAALLSHSNFGTSKTESALKMREALQLVLQQAPDLEIDGEMHTDSALSEAIRERIFPHSRLKGAANLLIMPNLDAANITFNALKVLGDGISVGPLLCGTKLPAHILTPSVTTRGILNMSAYAVVDAQKRSGILKHEKNTI